MISASRSSTHSPSMTGRTTSSAASMMREHVDARCGCRACSHTATNASIGVLPAPAPKRRVRAVDLHGAGADGEHRVGHAERRGSRGRGSRPARRRRARRRSAATRSVDLVEDQRAGRVDDVDALAAGVGHDPGLLGQRLRRLASGPSSGSRRSPGRARGRGRSAGRRCRPRCSGWRCGTTDDAEVARGRGCRPWCRRRAASGTAIFARVAVVDRGLDQLRSSTRLKP